MTDDRLDVAKLIRIHAVIPAEDGQPYELHTHGLEDFGHKEFQVYAPGYCAAAMIDLLYWHANEIINDGVVFLGGETLDMSGGVISGYVEVPGDDPENDPSRLRIVDLPGGRECEGCTADNKQGG